jgi:succinate dehydrogenase flavin-adding protein (antitoxin of CptAB toxin-antitoxin module)
MGISEADKVLYLLANDQIRHLLKELETEFEELLKEQNDNSNR